MHEDENKQPSVDIPPEIEAQIYEAIGKAVAPFVGRDVDDHLLGLVKDAALEAVEPFTALDEVPPIEIIVFKDPERELVRIKLLEKDEGHGKKLVRTS